MLKKVIYLKIYFEGGDGESKGKFNNKPVRKNWPVKPFNGNII
jgi:hypothetical protein